MGRFHSSFPFPHYNSSLITFGVSFYLHFRLSCWHSIVEDYLDSLPDLPLCRSWWFLDWDYIWLEHFIDCLFPFPSYYSKYIGRLSISGLSFIIGVSFIGSIMIYFGDSLIDDHVIIDEDDVLIDHRFIWFYRIMKVWMKPLINMAYYSFDYVWSALIIILLIVVFIIDCHFIIILLINPFYPWSLS